MFEDLAPLLVPKPQPGLGIRKAVLTAYDAGTGANTVTVDEVDLVDLPRLDTGAALAAGDVVLLLRYRSSWAILGRIVSPDT